jgi:DNA-binding response OmpR family regulator
MTIIHCSGVCLVTEESSDEFVVSRLQSIGPVSSFSKVYVFGRMVKLTQNESTVLELLMSSAGVPVSRNQILDALGDSGELMFRSIDTKIKRLRQKLFPNNVNARELFIQTLYCIGYKIPKR